MKITGQNTGLWAELPSNFHLTELPLALFVPWVGADHVDFPVTSDDFAILTNTLHTGADFHRSLLAQNFSDG